MSSKTDVDIAPPPTPAKKRKLRRFILFTCVALAVTVAGLLIYLNSGSFRETVRQRVITELRQMTGGTVEVESFTWNLSTLHFEARNVTIPAVQCRMAESMSSHCKSGCLPATITFT